MDFEVLFWIALAVFYLISKARKGKKRKQRPAGQPRPVPERRTRKTSPAGGNELGDALQEIRRALGYPEDPQPARGPQRPDRSEPQVRVEKPSGGVDAGKRRVERATPVRTTPRRAPVRRPSPLPDHVFESTFAEEEAFERLGRHPHLGAPVEMKAISPISPPESEQMSRIMRRLSGGTSLRDAFLIKEILDRPLALRGPGRRR